jgi:lysylphosphatidylglycerol synthetase-like protein (DUF2156 family)
MYEWMDDYNSGCVFLIVVASLSALELLAVLSVVGLLVILGVRLRVRSHTIILLMIIGVLLLAVISLGKITMTLFGTVAVLGLLLIVFVFRRWFERKLLGGGISKSLNRSCARVGGFH